MRDNSEFLKQNILFNEKTFFLSADLITYINKWKNTNAIVFDVITSYIFKSYKFVICDLACIVKISLENSIFPVTLKTSTLVPVLKKGAPNEMENNRAIHL